MVNPKTNLTNEPEISYRITCQINKIQQLIIHLGKQVEYNKANSFSASPYQQLCYFSV
jgi:hypothetical protein